MSLLLDKTKKPGTHAIVIGIGRYPWLEGGGAERLKSVFLLKLARLRIVAAEWAASTPAAILLLTRGRVAALRAAVPNDAIPILVQELPRDPGRSGLDTLRDVLSGTTASESGKQ